MASCGVLSIMDPWTIPIPQNLNHINQESHQIKTFSPICWHETKANRNETQGFLQEQQDVKQQLLGAHVWCVTQHRAQAPPEHLGCQVSTAITPWCPALWHSSGCDAPQFILEGKKQGSDSCPSQSWLPELHHERSRALPWALTSSLTQFTYAFLELLRVLSTSFSSRTQFKTCFTWDNG